MECAESFGVEYKPDPDPRPTHKSLDELLTPAITFVRIQWVDLINTVRVRVLPVNYFRKLFSTSRSRPSIIMSKAALGLVGMAVATGFEVVGEDLYVLDLSSWRVCTYASSGHASVMGWFQEMTPTPGRGVAIPLCPRGLLDRLVRSARDRAGVSFLVGVESEFTLLSATSPELVFVSDASWTTTRRLRTGSPATEVLEEVAICLRDAGIELEMYHPEGAPGQYEVITGPLSPLEAADALVFTRETIYEIANKHGLTATFAPRLRMDSCGSGAHTHISVHGGTPTERVEDVARAPALSPTERSFLQGLLTHLPAVCALTLPTAASYARMMDGILSGGTWSSWGTYNRETPVRLCGARDHSHFELRCVDGTSTPYLAIAGIIAAGLEGILDGALLTSGDCTKAVYKMTDEERMAVGLVENPLRLPKTISDAREELRRNQAMKEMLGDEFVGKYLSVNEILEKSMAAKDERGTVEKLLEYY